MDKDERSMNMERPWCECVKLGKTKLNSLIRTLLSLGADKDWVDLKDYLKARNTEKSQAVLELLNLANCFRILNFKVATRAETRSEKNFACIPIGADNWMCFSKLKLVEDWKKKVP